MRQHEEPNQIRPGMTIREEHYRGRHQLERPHNYHRRDVFIMAVIVNGKKVAGLGQPGKDGAPGKSAYQAAKEKGYTGTEEEFNTALAGMQSAPFLPLAGGIMQGPLSLSGNPTEGNHAANKQYVDEHAGSRVILGSYVGTGKSGESNPNQITLAEPFKILCIYGRQYTDSYESIDASGSGSVSNIIPSSIIPTEYTRGFGFFYSNNSRDSYGKKSADGKTFSWYFGLSPTGAANVQFNTSGVVYHYYAIV